MTASPMSPWRDVPHPVPGCDRCAELDQQRAAARRDYDGSAESDYIVLMRKHLEEEHL
ncbi:hypothetical protein [Streptomyces fractus]|uniref:hypothetical protein n=1 Tax=Streptomyces fractus TaxID=641806 RepID=UPI003CF3564D